jgi:dihydroflavonol-4-reductase
MRSKVLVTGATGCLGANLVRHLVVDLGAKVTIFKRPTDLLGPIADLSRDVEVRFGDVRDLDSVQPAMRGIEAVFHLAGIVIPLNRLANQMWEVNVGGTYTVMQAARAAGVRRIVHVSSIAAIGYPPDHMIASETYRYEDSVSSNAYSFTKHWGERIALGFNSADLEVVVVNPSAVIAPGGDRRYGWAGVIEAVKKGLLRVCPCGGSAFCTRHDLVDGLVRAMEAGRPGERYILSSENLSYWDLCTRIAQRVETSTPFWRAPRWLFRALGRIHDGISAFRRDVNKAPLMVSENTDLMIRTLFYDQSKAVHELGLSQSSVTEAIRETYEWCETGAMPATPQEAGAIAQASGM